MTSLASGTRLGPYEIVAPLGAGGMGEVYRARDTNLQREVAIKVLPDAFAADPERTARFRREAQTLAALNHPHIAQIHGFEESGDTRALVMELVEGETLGQRIARGPIPIDEALPIARQIAEALEAAHDAGIIHRDLKPANIKLRPDGTVKVLDFGLAKALEPSAGAGHDARNSPTITTPAMTQAGLILGTPAYMSPEQARGRAVDTRADIWAFGCVLYEMLAGRTAFDGDTVTDVLGAIVRAEPDWNALPADTPAWLRQLLRDCLAKDRGARISDVAVARYQIERAPVLAASEPAPTARKTFFAAAVAAALFITLGIPATRHLVETPVAAPEIHLELTTPPTTDATSLAISPDGQKLAFVATFQGRPAIWLRPLHADTSRPLEGTAGASYPFWSPDSRSMGFFADSLLKRVDIDGGSVKVLATASLPFSPGTWNDAGVILFSPVPGRPVHRVPGGDPGSRVTNIAPSQESGHTSPRFLPDGRRFLYSVLVGGGIYVGDVDRGEARQLVEDARQPMYVNGHLLFVRGDVLFAQRFDPERLEVRGGPFAIAERLLIWGPQGAAVAASESGTIVYRSASGDPRSQLVWFDRSGKEIGRVGDGPDPALKISAPSIARDGSRLALFRVLADNIDVWLTDPARGVLTRFTSNPANDVLPVWSPDGARLVFCSTRNGGVHDLYIKAASGGGEEQLLLATSQDKMASDWSPDGRHVLYYTYASKTQNDIWAVSLDGDRKPFPVVQTEFEERNGQFSPDGQWLAYQSNESGRFEIYVQPFPGPSFRTRISTDGGAQARWRADGGELFYVALDGRLMAVPMRLAAPGQAVSVGAPIPIMSTRLPLAPENLDGQQYVVSRDGQRFLINTVAEQPTSPIKVILNWAGSRED